MRQFGDLKPGAIIDFKFSTFDKATNAPITLAGSPAVSLYKDNGTTEITTGVTLTVDFDSRTGMHHVRIDTGSDASFHAAGSNIQAVITAGTVDSVSVVGVVLAEYSIRNRSPQRPVEIRVLAKYAVGSATQGKIRFQIPKADGAGHSVSADWTPASGDVKVSIDGATEANIGTLPAYANGAWEITNTSGEFTGKRITIRIADVAPKLIDDAVINVETFGHASALYPDDLNTGSGTAQTGDGYAVLVDATFGLAKLVRSATPANALAVAASGKAGATIATGDFADILAARAAYLDELVNGTYGLSKLVRSTTPANTLSVTAAGKVPATVATGDFADILAARALKIDNLDAAVSSRMATFTPLDAAAIRVAIGMAAANLDTQLAGLLSKVTNLPSDPADASDIVAAFAVIDAEIDALTVAIAALNNIGVGDLTTALQTHDGDQTGTVAADAGNSATTFKVSVDAGSAKWVGVLRFTSGARAGERCMGYITGTQFTVLSQSTMPTVLKQFGGVPANGVAFLFRAL